ncbi:MAG: LysR family transcriptional regulator [Pseudomonadota bacterium]
MSHDYPRLRRLAYFAAVAEAGSIRGAAERLRLSVPVLSAALADLEADLGVTLAQRTTRSFQLTEAGLAVQAEAQTMLAAAERAKGVGSGTMALSGHLGITLPLELAVHWLPPWLAQFQALHPGVSLSVDATDAIADLATGPYDVALRTTSEIDGAAKAPGEMDLTCVVKSPVPMERDGSRLNVPVPLLARRESEPMLPARDGDGTPVELHFNGLMAIRTREAARAMVRHGLGAAMIMGISAREDLDQGRLVTLDPTLSFGHIRVRSVFRDTLPTQAARAFTALLRENQAISSR